MKKGGGVVKYDPLFIFNPRYLYEDLSTSKQLDNSKRVIGVEVIPGSHMADRKTRFVSVRNMSRTNPETGSVAVGLGTNTTNDAAYIPWGNINDPVQGMTEYEYAGYRLKQDDSAVTENNPYGVLNELTTEAQPELYLATDYDNGLTGNEYPFFEGAYFPGYVAPSGASSVYVSAPYPFNSDGKKNLLYQNNGSGMAITDMNGKANTATLISRITEPDWNVGELKINDGDQNESGRAFNYPAAAACYRFNAGVNSTSGKWYLPSMGELGYLWANINKINAKINALGSGMGVAIGDPKTSYGEDLSVGLGIRLWSSSVSSSSKAWYLSTVSSYMTTISRDDNYYDYTRVRAFLSLSV